RTPGPRAASIAESPLHAPPLLRRRAYPRSASESPQTSSVDYGPNRRVPHLPWNGRADRLAPAADTPGTPAISPATSFRRKDPDTRYEFAASPPLRARLPLRGPSSTSPGLRSAVVADTRHQLSLPATAWCEGEWLPRSPANESRVAAVDSIRTLVTSQELLS